MVAEAIVTARAAGTSGEILVRGDSAYGSSDVVAACITARVQFSLVLTKNSTVARAIETIDDKAWKTVPYPGSFEDPETGELVSDAEVAEVEFTAFPSTTKPVKARLIVRRVRDQAKLDELFPVWRHHPFFTNSTQPIDVADITHRRHAVIETVFADLVDGPLAHLPSGRFSANRAWAFCAAITHNPMRAARTLTNSTTMAVARSQTATAPDHLRSSTAGPAATPALAPSA